MHDQHHVWNWSLALLFFLQSIRYSVQAPRFLSCLGTRAVWDKSHLANEHYWFPYITSVTEDMFKHNYERIPVHNSAINPDLPESIGEASMLEYYEQRAQSSLAVSHLEKNDPRKIFLDRLNRHPEEDATSRAAEIQLLFRSFWVNDAFDHGQMMLWFEYLSHVLFDKVPQEGGQIFHEHLSLLYGLASLRAKFGTTYGYIDDAEDDRINQRAENHILGFLHYLELETYFKHLNGPRLPGEGVSSPGIRLPGERVTSPWIKIHFYRIEHRDMPGEFRDRSYLASILQDDTWFTTALSSEKPFEEREAALKHIIDNFPKYSSYRRILVIAILRIIAENPNEASKHWPSLHRFNTNIINAQKYIIIEDLFGPRENFETHQLQVIEPSPP